MSDSDNSNGWSDDEATMEKVETLTSPHPFLTSLATLYRAPTTTLRSEDAKEVTVADRGSCEGGSGGRGGDRLLTWWRLLGLFVVLALATRFYCIDKPYKVVWDEAHFGKMIGWYINRTFFFDVHPFGGKLLLTLFGYLGGYDGTHTFETPSVPYEGSVGILPIRMGCALIGSALVPLAFTTIWQLTRSLSAATTAAILITFEIGTITLTKFILLEPPLFLFIMASFHGLVVFHNQQGRSFSPKWWLALTYCGAMLGCVMSVKFVGLFVVLVVGAYTIQDLFIKFGQLNISLLVFLYHLMARVLCLIVVPAAIYVTLYAIHEKILYKARTSLASDESCWSSGFQMQLQGNSIYNVTQPKQVAYGSVVTLRNNHLCGIYLHSHNLTYPNTSTAADRQQVTGFPAKDPNNLFRILFPEEDPDKDDFYSGPPEYLTHGDWVRLYHLTTSSLLACSRNRSLVSRDHKLVYAQPYNLTSGKAVASSLSAYSMWEVQIEDGPEGELALNALETRFKFVCLASKCGLDWSLQSLPLKWGGGHGEITCNNNLRQQHTNWIVEQHYNPNLRNATFNHLQTGFWSRFWETHQVMTWVNSRLKPQGMDVYTQHRPWMWPLLLRSHMWYDVSYRIVLFGNPVIFWINLVFLLIAPGILVVAAFRMRRAAAARGEISLTNKDGVMYDTATRRCLREDSQVKESNISNEERLVVAVRWLLLAYIFHYVPFYFMNRILYFHHYFPALHFSCMLTAVVFGYIVDIWLPSRLSAQRASVVIPGIVGAFYGMVFVSFLVYCHVGYGHVTEGPFNPDNSTFRHVRLLEDWEF